MSGHSCRLCERAKHWNGLFLGLLSLESAAIWVISWPLIQHDWTLIIPPLILTAGAMFFWYAYRKIYGDDPGSACPGRSGHQ